MLLFSGIVFSQGIAQKERKTNVDALKRADTLYCDTLIGCNATVIRSIVVTDLVVAMQGYMLDNINLHDTTYTKEEPFLYSATKSTEPDVVSQILSDSAILKINLIVLDDLKRKGKLY